MKDERLCGTHKIIAEDFAGKLYQFNYSKATNELYSVDFGRKVKRVIVKPNLELIWDDGHFYNFSNSLRRIPLIKEFYIDPEIFDELVLEGFLYYSSFSSDFYELPKEYSCDRKYHKNDYKRKKNKALVLQKFRNGEFN